MDSTVRSRPSHYEVLGLAPTASSTEIGQAFAREIGSIMPRPFGHLAEVTVAYETLRDPAKRSAYDASLSPQPEPKPEPEVAQSPARRHESASFLGMALVDRLERPAVQPTPPPPPPVEPHPRPEPRAEPPLAAFIAASERRPFNPDGREMSPPPAPKPEELRRPQPFTSPKVEWPQVEKPRVEPRPGDRAFHFAEAERLHFAEEGPINRKLPVLAAGALVFAVGFGAWSGLEAGNDVEQLPSDQAVTLKVPPADALPITTEPPPAPAPKAAEARPERRARAALADAPAAPTRPSLEIDLSAEQTVAGAQVVPAQAQANATEQAGEEIPYVEVKPRKMPLPNAVIARTIGRIGYPCGQVASTTSGGAPGVFKVTCTSGHSYRASPVRGRYHFRRLGRS